MGVRRVFLYLSRTCKILAPRILWSWQRRLISEFYHGDIPVATRRLTAADCVLKFCPMALDKLPLPMSERIGRKGNSYDGSVSSSDPRSICFNPDSRCIIL